MKIWHSLLEAHHEITKYNIRTILTIGNFDGVHRGHRAIMKRMMELKQSLSEWTVAVVFVNHTDSILGARPQLLNSLSLQQELMAKQGLDAILEVEFNSQLAETSASDFFKVWVEDGLQAKALVVGYDFHFGAGGRGDYHLLQELVPRQKIHLEQIPPLTESGITISSSNIRRLLADGEMDLANRMLGYSFIIEEMVTTGEQLGRKLGYPTANLKVAPQYQLPCYGVYLVRLRFDGISYMGLANVGIKPTFGGKIPIIEVYLFDVQVNLYQKMIRVEFLHFIRPEECFTSPEALQTQITKDVIAAKSLVDSFEDHLSNHSKIPRGTN